MTILSEFLTTTAKLGPGDTAPAAQINDKPISELKSIIQKLLYYTKDLN